MTSFKHVLREEAHASGFRRVLFLKND